MTSERVLHVGDTLKVADKSTLVLATGNAAVLDITVDGRKAPVISGTIRHEILLDPDRLLAGTAIAAPVPPAAPPPRPAPAASAPPSQPGVMQPVGN